MNEFTVYPAIDVREGRVVRLLKGDYDKQTNYAPDPLELAQSYAADGARWLHLVDLDAARAGNYTLSGLLTGIVQTTGLQVQTGGGVRTLDDVKALLDAGASRVVVGSAAVRDPDAVCDWLAEVGPERITIALDTRTAEDGTWTLPVAGWTSVGEVDLPTALHRFDQAGLQHLLCTDISRDGTLGGPNMHLYTFLVHSVPTVKVQASGGARDIGDVRSARRLGCGGIVLGKSLLEGRLVLAEAVEEESV